MKALLAQDTFLRYPDHNQPFHIYTDASDMQLGAAIIQNGAPVAYYSRKLNAAQRNYTVGEKELLSIVETLKEFQTMLYGCPELHVYTDHKNNTFQRLQTQRVLRWRVFLEDFGVQFHYIKGESNTLADALSCLPLAERQNTPTIENVSPNAHQTYFSMAIDDADLLDCFVNLPASEGIPFVLNYKQIREAQLRDARLQALLIDRPASFANQLLAANLNLSCYIPEPGAPWKIYLPTELLENAIRWYHLALGHLGQSRLYDSISTHLYHPNMKTMVENIVSRCDPCQRQKLVLRGHGHTAPREASAHPWQTVAVDLIGPWTLSVGGYETSFQALTIIDMVTNLVELVRIDNKSSEHVTMHFENTWLSRYPRPLQCIYDQGGEFIGYPFAQCLQRHAISQHPTSRKNPQANAICERMHQAVANTLRAMAALQPPEGIDSANRMVDCALANCLFASQAATHGTLKNSPGSLAFSRDMVLDIPLLADWELIRQKRQQLIDQRLIAANRKHFVYNYQIGDEVLKPVYKPKKLDPRATGPYRIEQVHTNGTLTIRLNAHTIERISIRRVKPYRR